MPSNSLPQTEDYAQRIAGDLVARGILSAIGIAILTAIISKAVTRLLDCFLPSSPTEVQDYVSKRYDAQASGDEYAGYDKRLLKIVTRNIRRSAYELDGSVVGYDDARKAAIVVLDSVKTTAYGDMQNIITETINANRQ